MSGKPVMAMSPVFGIMLPTDEPEAPSVLELAGPAGAAARVDPQLAHAAAGNAELAEHLRQNAPAIYPQWVEVRRQAAMARMTSRVGD